MSSFSSLIGQHFAFAHGRIGVLKGNLLKTTDVDRLLGANGIRDAEKILTELSLTNVIDQGVSDGDAILDAVGTWMRDEVNAMVPEEKKVLLSILWLDGDAPELSYVLKKQAGLTSAISSQPVSFLSAYPAESLTALVEKDTEGDLPSDTIAFVREIKAQEGLTAAQIDTLTAAHIADKKLALARVSGSRRILDYVRHTIDLQNIRTALRFLERDPEETKANLLRGGTIAVDDLAGDRETVKAGIARSNLGYSLSNIERLTDPLVFEREAADFLAKDIAAMWNVPLSIEPVFAFAAITVSQLRLIRAILIAKRNELPPQEIKKIQPPFLAASHYVS